MKLPLSWLNEFVTVDADTAQLCHRLSVAGLEVESVEYLRPPFSGVTIARILEIHRHPNADRLNLCEVEAGSHGRFRVVCGAPNVRPGMVAPLALVGARLGGQTGGAVENSAPLEAAIIRGERSEGMLCSGRELGLSDDHSGIVDLDPQAPLGGNLSDYLHLEDTILDVAITPNRGDCLSILGLAREVGALFGVPMRAPRLRPPRHGMAQPPPVEISAPEKCPRYAALLIDRVGIGAAPTWMRRRLELCGMRSISNIVDITNYVMLELGQPLHAFDFHKLGEGRIVVRQAGADREFVTLDGVERILEPTDLVIADGRRPIALAGVMGGQSSEISADTNAILLESAYFDPGSVARTARRLGLHSEASYRFERGIDRNQVAALWRAAQLVRDLAGGRAAAPVRDVEPIPAAPRIIELELARMEALLGVAIPVSQVRRRLQLLGAKVTGGGKGRVTVQVPSFRPDLREAADLAEEVARLNGLEDIPERMPARTTPIAPRSAMRDLAACAKDVMIGCGLTEIRTLAFTAPEDHRYFPGPIGDAPVQVTNPLSAELSELRRSLIPGLLAALRFNLNRQAKAFHGFELAKVFSRSDAALAEALSIAGVGYGELAAAGIGQTPIIADFASAKGTIEVLLRTLGHSESAVFEVLDSTSAPYLHPGKSARIVLNGEVLGVLGELHPEQALRLELNLPCALFELNFTRLAALARPARGIEPPPRFPAVRRDVALVVDRERSAGEVVGGLRQLTAPWLESIEVFDVYTGDGVPKGKKSLALTLRYRSRERTLTDEEVNRAHDNLVRQALPRLGAQLRQ